MNQTSSASNIIIDSSDSEESLENSIEIIGSDDEEDLSDSCDTDSFLDGKVQIFMAQGSFFIWNAEDVQMLREECRIVGKLVGCLPRAPRQNNQLGLPLQLMPEEAKLLEEIEACCVVLEQDVSDDVAQTRKTYFETMREENYEMQQAMYKESRKEEVRQHKHIILEGKRAKKRKIQESLENSEEIKRESGNKKEEGKDSPDPKTESSKEIDTTRLESTLETKEISSSDAPTTETDNLDQQKIESADNRMSDSSDKEKNHDIVEGESESVGAMEENVEDSLDVSEDCVIVAEDKGKEESDDEDFNVDEMVTTDTHVKHSLVQLFTENPWKETVKRPKHWIFPLSQKEFLRYEVFKDLWRKGYYLTSGSKFGGDYLVYPGDPARFHSHFIAVCIDKTIDLSALDIISLGRLGSNVRKTVLLCAFNKSKQIRYTSLHWTGIS